MVKTIVVGGGIAGLTAAFRLQQAGDEVRVLEAAPFVGGRMRTVRRDGFRMDVGAALLSSKYGALRALAADAGVAGELVEGADVLGVVRGGTVHRIRSSRPLDAVRTKLLSPRAKLAAGRLLVDAYRAGDQLDWYDLSRAADLDVESVADYAARVLPRETAEFLVDPIVRTIYLGNTGDVSVVDLLFTLRNFFGGRFLNGAGGIDFLCRALAARLDVQLGARVTDVVEAGGGVEVAWGTATVERADRCVIALSAHDMAAVHHGLSPQCREIVASLAYQDLLSVQVGLASVPAEASAAITIPGSESADLCAIIVDHNKAPGRAPAGKGLLGAYFDPRFVARWWAAPDADVCAAGLDAVERILPGLDVAFLDVHRFPRGVVVARPGTYKRLRRFHEQYPVGSRVQLAGDYVGGSTTNSALCSGERAARILIGGYSQNGT